MNADFQEARAVNALDSARARARKRERERERELRSHARSRREGSDSPTRKETARGRSSRPNVKRLLSRIKRIKSRKSERKTD